MGYNVHYKEPTGLDDDFDIDLEPVEVSLVYRGARPETYVGHVTTLRDIINTGKKYIETEKNKLINNKEKKNISNINQQTNQSENKTLTMDIMEEMTKNYMVVKKSNALEGSYAAEDEVFSILNRSVQETSIPRGQPQSIHATAGFETSEDMEIDTTNSSSQNQPKKSIEDIDSLINQYVDQTDNRENAEFEEYAKALKNLPKFFSGDQNFNIPLPESTLPEKLAMEREELKKSREPIPENCPPGLRKQIEEAWSLKDALLEARHKDMIKKDNELRTNLQMNLKNVLQNLLENEKANGSKYKQEDAEVFQEYISRASELGPQYAEGVSRYIEAEANLHKNSSTAANNVQNLFGKLQASRKLIQDQQAQIAKAQEELSRLKNENNKQKASQPINVKPFSNDSSLSKLNGPVKKVRSEASMSRNESPASTSISPDEMLNYYNSLNKYGRSCFLASKKKGDDWPTILDRTQKFNHYFSQPGLMQYDLLGKQQKMHEEAIQQRKFGFA